MSTELSKPEQKQSLLTMLSSSVGLEPQKYYAAIKTSCGCQGATDDHFAVLMMEALKSMGHIEDPDGLLDDAIEALGKAGGLVDIESRPGHGLRLTLRVPLTLIIIPALTISCSGQHFAIPRSAIEEIVRMHIKIARALH